MAKKREYIPKKRFNPIIQAQKLEDLRRDLNNHAIVLKSVISTYDKHVEHLANFANHDMKNSIQSMDSILYTSDYENLTQEAWESLKTCLKNIRNTFENFSKLVPYSDSKNFEVDRLFVALKLITKQTIVDNNINFEVNNPTNIELRLPFQSILQMLHNIVINAVNSIKANNTQAPNIRIDCDINEKIVIKISDNGKIIEDKLKDKIFEYGFSTTNGTGIGLYHAKYVCDAIKGTIELELHETDSYNKSFIINLPINI